MSEGPIIRPAGLLERYYIARQRLRMYTCVVVSANYRATNDAPLDRQTLFSALEKVILSHGALCVRLEGQSTATPSYARLDQIDLSRVVDFADESGDSESLAAVLESQISQGFKRETNDPLWRLRVLANGDVSFAWHHEMGDGQSGVAFHRSLLAALNDKPTPPSASLPILHISHDVSLVGPLENLTSLAVSPWKLFREILSLVMPSFLSPSYSAWTGHPVPSEDTFEAKLRLVYYEPTETSRILEICRAHGSTLTSMMHTLTVMIISRLLEEDPVSRGRYRHISTSIPISLRRLTQTTNDEMCSHVSTFQQFYSIIPLVARDNLSWKNDFRWDLAADLARTLREQQTSSAQYMGMLKFVGDYDAFFKRALGRKRSTTLEISNLGHFAAPASMPDVEEISGGPQWRMEEMYFAQSNQSSGAAIHVNVVGTPSGGIGISFTWGTDAIEEDFGERFCSTFNAAIDEMFHG